MRDTRGNIVYTENLFIDIVNQCHSYNIRKSSDICTTKIVVKVDNLGKIGETIK
jgi:hypothetical protein